MELLAVVREKLLSAGQPVTIAMFNTLFEVSCDASHWRHVYFIVGGCGSPCMQVLVDCPVRKIIDSHYVALDLSHQIKYPRTSGGLFCPFDLHPNAACPFVQECLL